jgi:hypothetical protein
MLLAPRLRPVQSIPAACLLPARTSAAERKSLLRPPWQLAELRERSVEAVKGLAIVSHPLAVNDHKVGLSLYATIGDRYW